MPSSVAIFWPAIVLALLTLGLFWPLVTNRVSAVKRGEAKAGHFKLRSQEPDASRVYFNAIVNQFETPVLFYAVVLFAFVTGQADGWMVALAWAYTLLKSAQTLILVTVNELRIRMATFAGALMVLTLMWILFAVRLLAL